MHHFRGTLLLASMATLFACTQVQEDDEQEPTTDDEAIVLSTEQIQVELAEEPRNARGPKLSSPPAVSAAPAISPPSFDSYAQPEQETSRFDNGEDNPVFRSLDQPVSTFSADVDTSSYAFARRMILKDGRLPYSESVRVEEFINAFDYDYPLPPSASEPFQPSVSVFDAPWKNGHQVIRIGIKGYDLEPAEEPDSNIVLLLDVSGSMNQPDKLPLVVKSMNLLVEQLDENDRLSVVVYAGSAGMVLEPTPGNEKTKIKQALGRLRAGGSTAGGEGLDLAYSLAQENFDPDKVNRVILATDGDFNVGITGDDPLEDFISRKRDEGIYLSILGFGAGNLNDQLMQRLAQNGNGVAAYIDDLEEARRILVREFTSSMFPIAEDVKFQVEFNPAAVKEYRLIGYQTRLLNEEDFDNDEKDAGEVGSGHTVTALYEVVPTNADGWLPERRYDERAVEFDPSAELAFLKIRYKLPGEDTSKLISTPITPDMITDSPSGDDQFTTAVSMFAEWLAGSSYAPNDGSFDDVEQLAQSGKGGDPYGDRSTFLRMVQAAREIDAAP
ncbi:MAG: von Willebrand factor type A domain-containing protein [Parvularculaceae bacterium]|nr:von Willebrand factor type A domain-containing protein [Parvularculaceae bacterium]